MSSEERIVYLIEGVKKVKNDAVLAEIETILDNYQKTVSDKPSIYDFVGIISKNEADEMMRAIADACENIDDNEWK